MCNGPGIWLLNKSARISFYILVSIELISEEIEDPFGHDINDLPTDNICSKIKKNIREILTRDD